MSHTTAPFDTDPNYELVLKGPIEEDFEGTRFGGWSPVKYGEIGHFVDVYPQHQYRRPVLATSAKLAGSRFENHPPLPPGDWGFVRLESMVKEGDLGVGLMGTQWSTNGVCFGSPYANYNWAIIRSRSASAIAAAAPTRWSCRHVRLISESRCSVCAALYFRSITT